MLSPVQYRVSLVIVNWKTPDLLARCLESLATDRGFSEFEIIVVDNDSGDESVPMLKSRFAHVKLIENKGNYGFSKGCNQAIDISAGKYILLLNPDTVIVDNAVSIMADYLDENPEVGAVGPRVLNADGSLQLACRRSFPSISASFFRLTYLSLLFPKHPAVAKYNLTNADPNQFLAVDALSGSAMMVRRSIIENIGLLDEDIFMFGEDIDWCWRIKETGAEVMYIPTASVYHVHGAASRKRPVGTTINLHKGMEVFYRKHMAKNHLPITNLLVYAAIWLRAAVFIVVNVIRGLLPTGKPDLPGNQSKGKHS